VVLLGFGLRTDPGRYLLWEREIQGLGKRLAEKPPAKGGILFAGSSTIRLWKLDASFPDWHAINTGFGGSEIRDATHFAERIIVPHAPKTIVFYSGDNDIGNRRTAEAVLHDFQAFTHAIHARLPETRILFLAIKPSIKRWNRYAVQQRANASVKAYCATNRRLGFIDTVPITLGSDGRPRADFLASDGLHLNEAGYAAWAPLVRQAVEKP
jgi:lysophospholipase L1-like esterase